MSQNRNILLPGEIKYEGSTASLEDEPGKTLRLLVITIQLYMLVLLLIKFKMYTFLFLKAIRIC
jgi:hypothetical protein